ncbi:MAG: DEAD/DEAH box helicase family protein [Deltaproteobacteria bacterium]|nr:DEAD/DEAH box helicase family protein [Deltaproteobacteria bacterium]
MLPTGSGKTHVAVMAMERCRRATLVVAPTLDLVSQWYELLRVEPSAATPGRISSAIMSA